MYENASKITRVLLSGGWEVKLAKMALNHCQEHRDIKTRQCKHKLSQFYSNYFLHIAFRVFSKHSHTLSYKRLKYCYNRIQRLGGLCIH